MKLKKNFPAFSIILLFILFVSKGAFNVSTQSIKTLGNNIIPEPRFTHQMTYDEVNKQVLLFGGANDKKVFGDLWSWNGTGWKELSASGPPPRNKGLFVYDPGRKVAVLYSGSDSIGQNLGDTWEWNGNSWKQIIATSPPARLHSMGVYDSKNKVVLIYGGIGQTGLLTDTWAFGGNNWKLLDANGPTRCIPQGIIYNEVKRAVIMLTVSNPEPGKSKRTNDMWEWMGASWKKLPCTVATSGQSLQAVSGFGKNGILIYDGDDTLQNMGNTWSLVQKDKWVSHRQAGPGNLMGHVMVYDKNRKKTLLFGGTNRSVYFNGLWEWDGKRWKKLQGK